MNNGAIDRLERQIIDLEAHLEDFNHKVYQLLDDMREDLNIISEDDNEQDC